MLKGMLPEMKAKLGLGLATDYCYLTMVGLHYIPQSTFLYIDEKNHQSRRVTAPSATVVMT